MKKYLIAALLLSTSFANASEVAFSVNSMPMKTAFASEWDAVKSNMEVNGEFVDFVMKSIENKSDLEKLHFVNNAVNYHVKYVTDYTNNGVVEKWQNAQTTFDTRKGDCEDYAILKMAILQKANFNHEMNVVVVAIKKTNGYHAVLSVKLNDKFYILDNNMKNARTDEVMAKYYTGIFTIGYNISVIHGKEKF